MNSLRRFYNAVDMLFDRQTLRVAQRFSRPGGSQGTPLTAREAFALCLPLARNFDRGARLKQIVSPDGDIQQNGASRHWEFFFDLPKRRARMNCDWQLPWDEDSDGFGSARIEAAITPFPAQNSLLYQMVKEGRLLYRQLSGLWKEERRRKADLPVQFRDSDEIMLEFAGQGLDVTRSEVTLAAECKQGERPYWVAQTREVSFRARFA